MSSSPNPPASHWFSDDARFAEILEAFTSVILTGDERQIATFLDSHLEVRERLEQFLPAMRAMTAGQSGDVPSEATFPHAASSPLPRGADPPSGLRLGMALGDFQLVREIGRGGMGVVYEANQLSMPREVAVKVLPFAGLAGEKPLKRFQNEVRAAALLDHPHIVSVYSVGEERGIHYYAMQLIRGQSLASVIEKSRGEKDGTPNAEIKHARSPEGMNGPPQRSQDHTSEAESTLQNAGLSTFAFNNRHEHFRHVARLGIQAAEALQHAHDHGVVHRDIKPGNLLLDVAGQLRVTDFGLANIESDANLTATGELVGTLRYMSPEQALAQRGAQDHRTDIYSLGATLYELLTLEPVFAGDDRAVLLDQIRFKEPRAPREVDPSIPADLETVLLKALEKEPTDRYQSATDLADDLKRFASGHTIRAKRPSSVDRLSKWALRNRSFVMIGGVMALAVCVMLATSTWLVWNAKTRTQRALHESQQHASQVEDLLYAADMQLAYKAWDEQQLNQVQQILDRQRPEPGARDLRGFEWHLLEAITQQRQPRILGQHEGAANELAIFPDGESVASVGDDGRVRIWHIETGELLKTIDTGDVPLHSVAISPDGMTVATGATNITGSPALVQLWSVASGELEMVLTEHEATVEAIAFSPDGTRIATGSRYDEVRIFSRSGELLKSILDKDRHVTLEFTDDGQLLVPSKVGDFKGPSALRVWHADGRDGFQEINLLCDMARSSADGECLLLAHRKATLVHAKTGKELLRLPPNASHTKAIAISSDARLVAAGFADGSVNYWVIEQEDSGELRTSGKTLALNAHQGDVHSVQLVGATQLVTCGRDGMIKVWDLRLADNPRLVDGKVNRLRVLPTSGTIASIDNSRTLRLHTLDGDELRRTPSAESQFWRNVLTVSPDERLVVTTDFAQQKLQIRNANTLEVFRELELESIVEDACFSPTGETLVVSTYVNTTLHFLNLESMEIEESLPLGNDKTVRVRYSLDGSLLVCAGSDSRITLVNAQSKKILRQVSVASAIESSAMSCCGGIIATGHKNGHIRLRSFPDLQSVATLVGHVNGVRNLAFHPDGETLASASSDGTIRLWSINHQREWGVISRVEKTGWANDVAFSSDGKRFYTGNDEPRGLKIFSLKLEGIDDQFPNKIDWQRAKLSLLSEGALANAGYDFALGPGDTVIVSDYEIQRIDATEERLLEGFAPQNRRWRRISAAANVPRIALADAQQVIVYDYEQHAEIAAWSAKQLPRDIAISPDGRCVAVIRENGAQAIELFNVDKPESPEQFFALGSTCLRFSPAGNKLAVGNTDELLLIELGSDRESRRLRRISLASTPADVAFAPDNRYLAIGQDRCIQVVDTKSGRIKTSKNAEANEILTIDFSCDGHFLVTGGDDTNARIWSADTLQQLLELPASERIIKVRFARDGQRLFVRLRNGTLATFDAKPTFEISRAESLPVRTGRALFEGLGQIGFSATPRDISENGEVVVGSYPSDGKSKAFRWTKHQGIHELSLPSGYSESWAMDVNEWNGRELVVGRARNESGTYLVTWDDEQRPTVLEQPSNWRSLYVCESDGTVMVGYALKSHVSGKFAFLYDGQITHVLPDLHEGYSTSASKVRDNGRFVLGATWRGASWVHSVKSRNMRIVRWQDGEPQVLPGIDNAPYNWRAIEESSDGQFVAGCRWPYGDNGKSRSMAIRWEKGKVQILGDLPGGRIYSYANGMSADGRVIVGRSFAHDGRRAFVWDDSHGMRRLDDVLEACGAQLSGWQILEATRVSADATKLIGVGKNPSGRNEAFIAELPVDAW